MHRKVATASCILVFAGAVFWPVAVTAASEAVLYSFPSQSVPHGRVLEDDSGIFYATAYGSQEPGAVYQLRQQGGEWRATDLHDFSNTEAHNPLAGVVQDPSTGDLFGTTYLGGTQNLGAIYMLHRTGKSWKETVLYSFIGSDGSHPAAELRRDSATNLLYGTASQGGSANCGTFFQFDPATSEFKTLYEFHGGEDGCGPTVQLRPGSKAGTLVGATQYGASGDFGTIFLLTEKGGTWKESVIHSFHGGDGSSPSDLDVASDGTVYGVAMGGGSHNQGVVFRLSPGGKWKYKIIHQFAGGDGNLPVGINLQPDGNVIYGTTEFGGAAKAGVVFGLTRVGSRWDETVLHDFANGSDGGLPDSRPAVDPRTGVLYGVTRFGGAQGGGVFYSVTP